MKDNRETTRRPPQIKWEFDPDVPTIDFFEGQDLNDDWVLQDAVEGFVFYVERARFATWEAVVCQEQGLPLTRQQEDLADGLLDFGDPDDDPVLYIDDMPRTSEPWHEILNKIVPHLLIEPFRTFDIQNEVQCDGWDGLLRSLDEHGGGLSLPQGAASPVEVVPAELRHKLRLQSCFDELSGLGQEEEISLERQPERVDWFIDRLRERKDTVEYLDLTLESLLTRVILPERDRPLFITMMQEKLGVKSTKDRIADCLAGKSRPRERSPITRLPEGRIKQGILHPEQEVRDACVFYFAGSFSQDPAIMPLVIQAIDRHGWDDAFGTYSFIGNLVQTEETVRWAIDRLEQPGQPDNEEEAGLTSWLLDALTNGDPNLIQAHEDRIMELDAVDEEVQEEISERIRFAGFSPKKLWAELEKLCNDNKSEDYLVDEEIGFAHRLVEAMGRHTTESNDRLLSILAQEIEDYANSPLKWMEPFAVRLAGELRLEAAVHLIIEKLREDDDVLESECIRALVKIGTDQVVDALADYYPTTAWGYRFAVAEALCRIHSDRSVERCGKLLDQEEDIDFRCRLCQAILGDFAEEGIEPARQLLLENELTPDLVEVRRDLLNACMLMGTEIPEFEQWKQEAEHDFPGFAAEEEEDDYLDDYEEEEEDDYLDDYKDEPLPSPDTIVRDRAKTGRNDPCPCGSGKKYKKCCLKKGNGKGLFD